MNTIDQQQQGVPTLSTDQWREDLLFFAGELIQRHKNPYHLVTEEKFRHSVKLLEEKLPSLRDFEIVVGIQHLAALIGDGHTRLETTSLFHRLPIETFWFGRILYILRTTPAYREALGTHLVKIGQCPISEVQTRLQAVIPQGENRWYILQKSADLISQVDVLVALGLLPQVGDTLLTLRDDTGKEFSLPIAPVSPNARPNWVEAVTEPPYYGQRREEPFWFTLLPDGQTLYLNFRRYPDLEKNAQQLWTFVDQQSPKRLLIDVRQNGGGDFMLGRQHLLVPAQSRRTLNNKGHLFVITGRQTFSAAMVNAIDFHRETDALLVGEPIGARPTSYQERGQFTLPNSRLTVSCSILYYRFQDRKSPTYPLDKRIDPTWASYKAGVDPVVEWISRNFNED